MKIHRLTIQNFRGFGERTLFNPSDTPISGPQNFTFSEQFNVLVGDNGSGKTAILDALAIAIGSLFLGFDEVPSRFIHADEVHIARYQFDQTETREQQYPVQITCDGTVDQQRLQWSRTLDKTGGRTTRQKAQDIERIARNLQAHVRKGEPITLPLIAYYGTGRLWLQKKEGSVDPAEPGSRLRGYRACLEPASDEKMMTRWFKQMELAALQRQVTIDTLEAVRDAVNSCVEYSQRLFFDISRDELVVELKNGQILPLRMLSDGIHNMLAMVADIAYRAAVLNPQFGRESARKTPGVVLIDEIDLHLHPNWQRRVVEDLRSAFPVLQFITTTHSPFIIQSLRAGELINLDPAEPAEYVNRSIEDIAEQVMGVEEVQRSDRTVRMVEAAKQYYRALENAKGADDADISQLRERLDELIEPFSDDPAYVAFLEMKREAAGLGDNHAASE